MPSAPTLDVNALLTPIAGENPAGASLRYEPIYDVIKEARRSDDTMNKGDWQREAKTADWRKVTETASDALATKSKDLQLAAWLTEAVVKQRGFAGLRDSFQLLKGLHEQFWDPLYPEVEDGDLEARVMVVEFLNRELPPTLRQIPVTQGENYSWSRWKESREVDNLSRQNPTAHAAALAEGKITVEQFDKAVTATPPAYYLTLFEDLNQTWEEYQKLDQVMNEKFGRDAPSLLEVKKVIEECRTLVNGIAKQKGVLPEPTTDQVQETGGGEAVVAQVDGQPVPVTGGTLPLEPQNRVDALRRLEAVAAFFHRTEPHSPVAYLVERAVQWAQMPLEQWLQEVVKDTNVLTFIRETLGLKDSQGSS